MKTPIILLMAAWVYISASAHGTETAQARLYCTSLRFAEGTTYGGTLDLTTFSGTYNGELITYSDNTAASYFSIFYGGYGEIDGTIQSVNLPPVTDLNSNGFNDFFEVSRGVASTVTLGYYQTYISEGTITATWSRAAGSKNGTCVLNFNDDIYGDLGDYNCPFTLLEYTGPLTYTPGSNTVSAAISLTQTGNPVNALLGPVIFDKSSTDRFNTLTNKTGVWTNAAMRTLVFYREVFVRDTRWPTNYAGYVYFADGDPSTTTPDYQLWVLSIDDTNDANGNGIPDFSDDPAVVTPPRAPQLVLTPGTTNLWLAISGDVGRTNLVQEISSLADTNWQTMWTLVATNDPQIISLPPPGGTNSFWRVVAQ